MFVSQVKSFEVCELPVRAAKFVARKNWVVSGSDDMQVSCENTNDVTIIVLLCHHFILS